MKTSDKCAVGAGAAGLIAGLATAWFGGSAVASIIVGLVAAGALYAALLKQLAAENIANLNDRR